MRWSTDKFIHLSRQWLSQPIIHSFVLWVNSFNDRSTDKVTNKSKVKNKPQRGIYWSNQQRNRAYKDKIQITVSEQYKAFNIASISRLITHLPTQPPILLSYVNNYQLKLESSRKICLKLRLILYWKSFKWLDNADYNLLTMIAVTKCFSNINYVNDNYYRMYNSFSWDFVSHCSYYIQLNGENKSQVRNQYYLLIITAIYSFILCIWTQCRVISSS